MSYLKYLKSHFTLMEIDESLLDIYKNMSNEEAFKPNKTDSNEIYHEQVNKIPPFKIKGNESKPNFFMNPNCCPVNETKSGYGDPETIGTFSTTVNKRAEVTSHTNYNNKRGPNPKTPTIKKCTFCHE